MVHSAGSIFCHRVSMEPVEALGDQMESYSRTWSVGKFQAAQVSIPLALRMEFYRFTTSQLLQELSLLSLCV